MISNNQRGENKLKLRGNVNVKVTSNDALAPAMDKHTDTTDARAGARGGNRPNPDYIQLLNLDLFAKTEDTKTISTWPYK